jgi:hypothetical protein
VIAKPRGRSAYKTSDRPKPSIAAKRGRNAEDAIKPFSVAEASSRNRVSWFAGLKRRWAARSQHPPLLWFEHRRRCQLQVAARAMQYPSQRGPTVSPKRTRALLEANDCSATAITQGWPAATTFGCEFQLELEVPLELEESKRRSLVVGAAVDERERDAAD